MAALVAKLCAGTAFGAALTVSGVYSPWIIISQMKFQDFHMLQAFMTASSVSAVAVVVARKLGFSECTPRSPSNLGLFSGYDGNIVGGVVLGVGMTLTGACPGTVFAQMARGIRSSYFAMLGGLVAGETYSQLAPRLINDSRHGEKCLTIYQKTGSEELHAVLGFEALCIAVVLSAAYFTDGVRGTLVHPITGGLLIGVGQITSLALTGNAVGVSPVFEQLARLISRGLRTLGTKEKHSEDVEPLPRMEPIAFAAGIVGGALAVTSAFKSPIPGGEISIPAWRALVGGFAMVFGARMAGGCTSGHGISGMSTLSISSFITVASIFAGGMALAAALY